MATKLQILHEDQLTFSDAITNLGKYFLIAAVRNILAAITFTLLYVAIAATVQAVGSLEGLWTILTTGVIPAVEFVDLLTRVCANELLVVALAKAAIWEAVGLTSVVCCALVASLREQSQDCVVSVILDCLCDLSSYIL